MMSGKGSAAAIALLATPVIARLFSPADFGVAAAFASMVGIICNVVSLRYESALVLPKDDAEAITIMALTYRIIVLACLLLLVFISLYSVSGLEWPLFALLGGWLWLLPAVVLLDGAMQVQENFLSRTRSFRAIATSLVIGTSVSSAARIGFGLTLGSSIFGLIVGNAIGLTGRFTVQTLANVEAMKMMFRRYELRTLKSIARQYSDFPKLSAPASLIFALGQNLPVLLFGLMFSPAVAGFYAMAHRLSQTPIRIVTMSTRRVFMQKIASVNNSGKSLRKGLLLTCGTLALLGALPFTLLWFYGQPLVTILLSERWFEAGRYLEIMAPWLFSLLVATPVPAVFVVLRRQNYWLWVQIAITILRLAALGLAVLFSATVEVTLGAFVAATVFSNAATVLLALMIIGRHDEARLYNDPGVSDSESGNW